MKKIRFYYWIIKSFTLKHKKILVPAAIIGAITFTQIGLIVKYLPKAKPVRHIGRIGVYTLSNLPKDIQGKISDGLTSIDDSGNILPALAKDWKIIDDGKTYIFTLKDNATWQDKTPLTSSDVNYNISDVTIDRPDDKTIIFKLKEPFSPFPTIVNQPLFKREQKSYLQIFHTNKIIGTGDYHISQIKFDGNYLEEITLESIQEKLHYRFYNTEKAVITSFKLAEIDYIEDISNISELESWPQLTFEKNLNMQRYLAIFFNTQDRNLTNKIIRQALTYATPGKPYDDTRALGPISRHSWAYNPNVKPYDYSPEKAKELAAGNNMNFDLELTTTPTYTKLADDIKNSWQELGINVKVKVVNVPDTQNFQALLIGQQIPLDPDQYQLWHSTQNSNLTHYQSPKIDKLLEDGRTLSDQQKRKETYLDFQRFLVEDTPAAFIKYLDTTTVKRN